jgi:hypothetical protein
MGLEVLRAGAAAFGRWQGHLAEPDFLRQAHRRCHEAWEYIKEKGTTDQGGRIDAYTCTLYSETGQEECYEWWFGVTYTVTLDLKRGVPAPRFSWIFLRRDRDGEALIVEGTSLSMADQTALALWDDLWVDEETGRLYVGSIRLPFGMLVKMPRKISRALAPLVPPLIVVSRETRADEILPQLCVFALRSDLFDHKEEILAGLKEWLRRWAPHQPEAVSDSAAAVIQYWSRPSSSRSFRDYCRRTVTGMIKNRWNMELGQRRIAGKLAGRVANHKETMAVAEFARESGVPRITAYRWLQQGRISGDLKEVTTKSVSVLGFELTKRHRRYSVAEAALAESENLLRERDIRRLAVKVLVERRNITPRAARAWVRRRIQKGASLEQIAKEAMDGL